MKKITSIATALCMATAFCGFCAGCASEIEANGVEKQNAPAAQVSSVESTPKVILVPGYQFGYGTTANTVASGATKLTTTEEGKYFVHNAYFATVDGGAELPEATTTRANTTFVGWTYAENGVVKTVKNMPATLTDDLYLFAQWNVKGTGSPVGPIDPIDPIDPIVPTPGGSIVINGTATALVENTSTDTSDGRSKEYWCGDGVKIDLTSGSTVSFTVDGKPVSAYIESSSSGVDKSNPDEAKSEFSVTTTGKFAIYLKYYPNGDGGKGSWSVTFAGPTTFAEVSSAPQGATAVNLTFTGGSTVTLYLKSGSNGVSNLSNYKLWAWSGGTNYTGGTWPGTALASSMTIKGPLDDNFNIIINWNSGGAQTQTFHGFESGCSYVITLVDKGGSVAIIR